MSIRQIENETTIMQAKLSSFMLCKLSEQAPFSDLFHYLRAKTLIELQEVEIHYNAATLNRLWNKNTQKYAFTFVAQSEFHHDCRYYEQIIYQDGKIPTRDNWHDFFNALIWSQFTQTKRYFNEQHILQMERELNNNEKVKKQRSPVRDRITHYDECGLVLFTSDKEVEHLIKEHKWIELFVSLKKQWHDSILPIIVGHALWEMLMSPFIGLTSKVNVVHIGQAELSALKSLKADEFYAKCDELLLGDIKGRDLLNKSRPWLPLPLLGIPNWSPFEQNEHFYQNEQYFMPKRQK